MTEGTAITVAEQETSLPEGYYFAIEDVIKEHVTDLIRAFKDDLLYYANELWRKHLITEPLKNCVLEETTNMPPDLRANKLFIGVYTTIKSQTNELNSKKAHVYRLISVLNEKGENIAKKMKKQLREKCVDFFSEPVRGNEMSPFSYQTEDFPDGGNKTRSSFVPHTRTLPSANVVPPQSGSRMQQRRHTDASGLINNFGYYSQETDQEVLGQGTPESTTHNTTSILLSGHQKFHDQVTELQQMILLLREIHNSSVMTKEVIERLMKKGQEEEATDREELKTKLKEDSQEKKEMLQQKDRRIAELEQALKNDQDKREKMLQESSMKREQLLCDSLTKERQVRIQDLERQQTDLTERSKQLERLSNQQIELERRQSEGLKRLEDLITKEFEKLSIHQTELESQQAKGLKQLEDLITKELEKLSIHQTELESQQAEGLKQLAKELEKLSIHQTELETWQAEGLKKLEDLIMKEQKECEKLSKDHIKEIERYFKQYCFLMIAVIVTCIAVLIYSISH